MIVILDNGHGVNTSGKRSPVWNDGKQLFEWEFNRVIVRRVREQLLHLAIPFATLVPEHTDVSLPERCRRANSIYARDRSSFLVSVHANAGGGTGWECFTSVGETKSDKIASIFYECAEEEFKEARMRKDYSDGDPDKESQFYILKHTACPAVLTENFFMDNEQDCRTYLLSEVGRDRIARMHVNAIVKTINTLY